MVGGLFFSFFFLSFLGVSFFLVVQQAENICLKQTQRLLSELTADEHASLRHLLPPGQQSVVGSWEKTAVYGEHLGRKPVPAGSTTERARCICHHAITNYQRT
jgi:hypothetical protein